MEQHIFQTTRTHACTSQTLARVFQIVQGNLALFCTHAVDLGDYFSTFILILLVNNIPDYSRIFKTNIHLTLLVIVKALLTIMVPA